MLDKNGIAKRIAKEVKDGYYVNLGIGIPTLVANFVRDDIQVEFQSENGILGMGPFPFEGEEDADLDQRRKANYYGPTRSQFFRLCHELRNDSRAARRPDNPWCYGSSRKW